MSKSHAAGWPAEAPTAAQLKEFFAQIEVERITRSLLQDFLRGLNQEEGSSVTLYLHPVQKPGGFIEGHDLKKHLEETGIIERCLSLEDKEVKEWLAHPETYPHKFKSKSINLWKNVQSRHNDLCVAYLFWADDNDKVFVEWHWLGLNFHRAHPAAVRTQGAEQSSATGRASS